MSAAGWPRLARSFHFNEVVTDGGMVVGPDQLIAEAGAQALRAGGNAVDAVVAASFADGVVEPPMSGLGGSATMTIAFRDPARVAVVEGHMVAPRDASSAHYPLAKTQPKGGLSPGGWSESFFDLPNVEGFANVVGAKAVATPGAVACLLAAHERFGSLPRHKVLEPAIALAADGFPVNWYLAALVTRDARALLHDPGCTQVFLPRRLPLRGPVDRAPDRFVQPQLARTLELIAAKGPDVFYRGEVGASIVRTVREAGGLLSTDDLEAYEPAIIESPPTARYGRYTLAGPPVSGFPTVLEALYLYDTAVRQGGGVEGQGPHDDPVAWARALRLAFADRFQYMTTAPDVAVPWDGLRSPAYARARLEAHLAGDDRPEPHRFSGEDPGQEGPAAARGLSGHTSQIAAVDREGNLVSLTATILASFGARVLDPETGVLLNNGMAYFDPRPGTVNGIRPGVAVFSNMSPMVLLDDERGPIAAVGASGGRRIISGVAQIVAALTTGRVSLQQAVEEPRIHAESDTVLLDSRWPESAAEAIRAAGFDVVPTVEEPTTTHFARPNGIVIDPDGTRRSGVDPAKPGGAAVA